MTTWQWFTVPSFYAGLTIGSLALPAVGGLILADVSAAQRAQLTRLGFEPLGTAPAPVTRLQ
jgi:hypothetical protein